MMTQNQAAADATTVGETLQSIMAKTTGQFAGGGYKMHESIDASTTLRENYQATENDVTTDHNQESKQETYMDAQGEKVIPETALSKGQSEIDRSEMLDQEEVKVNFPKLKPLHPSMSKTVQQGAFAKITHIDEEEEENLSQTKQKLLLTDAMNQTHQNLVSPPDEMLKTFQTQPKSYRAYDRSHMLAAKVIDLTHDTMPDRDKVWKPIMKTWDKIPPQPVMNDKIFLREWEHDVQDQHFSKIYDRRHVDIDVIKPLIK